MEGTTATAAATATPTTQTATTQPNTTQQSGGVFGAANKAEKAEVKPQNATQPAEGDEWGEEQDKQLASLLSKKSKKDPAFRLRHKGEEKALESLDDLKTAILDAQRGRGANKLVEEAKKEREAISQQKAQMDAVRQAFESGDPELAEAALKFLAGDRAYDLAQSVAERRKQEVDEYEGMSPRERALMERNKALESEFQRVQQLETQQKQEALERQKQAKIKEVSAQAREKTVALLKELNLSEDAMAVYGPHVVSVMREARELGQEVGTEITFEQVKQAAIDRARMSTVETLQGLSPQTAYNLIGDKLVRALVKEHLSRHGRASNVQKPMQQAKEEEQAGGPQFGSRSYIRNL